MIQHALDGFLMEMHDEDIICRASDIHGNLLRQRRSDRPVDSLTLASPETANTPGGLLIASISPLGLEKLTFDLLTYSLNLASWRLWGGLGIFRAPASTDELDVGPIWDCSDEASTSGTEDRSGTEDKPHPREELRRRKLFL
jgi:hypothetical protein